MKKLIIVRHGSYGVNQGLSERGQKQMELLGAEIKEQHMNGCKPPILASSAKRAVESAEILKRILEASVSYHEILWSESIRRTRLPEVLEMIKGQADADIVIIVTHFEYTEELPSFFAREVFGVNQGFPFHEVEKGGAWVIDCVQRSIAEIHPLC